MTKIGKFVTRAAAVVLAAGLAGSFASQAQAEWPERAVTLVVPYGPGASNDTFTRALADILTQKMGQPFIVENRAGAGGFTGSRSAADSEPDGYTFLEVPNSVVGFEPLMKVDLNPLEDLKPVGLLARAPTAMVVPASLGVNTVAEFIAHAKANPDSTFYGAAGIGTTQQQHAELFNQSTGLKLLPVNYKSSADAQTDLMAGRLQVMFVTVASTLGQIESGQLKLLAYSDDNYPKGAPDAPTLAQEGVEGMEIAQIFWSIWAPAGTPDEIVDAMNAEINEALQNEKFEDLMAKTGATPAPGTPEDLIKVIKDERKLVDDFLQLGLME